MSPSMRREWIEIRWARVPAAGTGGLPPCGGSGLKSHCGVTAVIVPTSPSMRREWIEIQLSFPAQKRT